MTSALDRAGFDKESVERLQESLPETTRLRPAIPKLSADQLDLIGRFVDGFDSLENWLLWGQDASIRTLGELSGNWLKERTFSRADLSMLLNEGRDRRRWTDGVSLASETVTDARRGVASLELVPACVRAQRRLRWDATEYVNDRDDSFQPEPGVQKHVAMRPALSEMDDNQAWALRQLLRGFDSADAFLAWYQTVSEASYAEIDVDLARRFHGESHTRTMLLRGDVEHAATFREFYAAEFLIPAFSRAAREVSERAGELAEAEKAEVKTNYL